MTLSLSELLTLWYVQKEYASQTNINHWDFFCPESLADDKQSDKRIAAIECCTSTVLYARLCIDFAHSMVSNSFVNDVKRFDHEF